MSGIYVVIYNIIFGNAINVILCDIRCTYASHFINVQVMINFNFGGHTSVALR